MDTTKRTALVTGAGRGIGAATARELGRRGYSVIVNYRSDSAAAQDVADAINKEGGEARPVQADVCDPTAVAELVRDCGPLDALVCNANISPPFAPVEQMPWDRFIGKVEGELAAAFHVTRAVLPGMRERGHGRIIYVSSLSADLTRPGAIAHATAKAALNTFARHVAAEAGPHGVTVNIVAPGAVHTDGAAAMRTPETEDALARRSVLGRMTTPEDVSDVIASLLDDRFRAVTGINVTVDGGFRVLPPPS